MPPPTHSKSSPLPARKSSPQTTPRTEKKNFHRLPTPSEEEKKKSRQQPAHARSRAADRRARGRGHRAEARGKARWKAAGPGAGGRARAAPTDSHSVSVLVGGGRWSAPGWLSVAAEPPTRSARAVCALCSLLFFFFSFFILFRCDVLACIYLRGAAVSPEAVVGGGLLYTGKVVWLVRWCDWWLRLEKVALRIEEVFVEFA